MRSPRFALLACSLAACTPSTAADGDEGSSGGSSTDAATASEEVDGGEAAPGSESGSSIGTAEEESTTSTSEDASDASSAGSSTTEDPSAAEVSSGPSGEDSGEAGESGTSSPSETTASGELFTVAVELASDVDPQAPGTIGIVTWSVELESVTEARIEFGLDESYGMTAPVDLEEPELRTLLLGMKPSRTYHFRITAISGGTTYQSDDFTVDTGPPTDLVPIGEFTVGDETARERGFIVASFWQGQGSSIAFILDADGEVVWWYDTNAMGIARARMSEDGKNMWMIVASNQGGPLQRVSMDTLDGEVYSETVGSHDLTPVSGATMAYLDYGETDCDSIFEIDPSGVTEEVFESQGVLMGSGCHGNALRYSAAEDVYTFSDVQQDILVVNRTGDLAWRLSELLDGGIDVYGGRQHGHHLLDDSMVVFANSWGGNDESVVVEYDLEGTEIWSYEGNAFTANLGDVQRLPGGNTLVTYSNDSLVREVTPAGDVVLEFDGSGSRIGYTLWRASLYGPPPDLGL